MLISKKTAVLCLLMLLFVAIDAFSQTGPLKSVEDDSVIKESEFIHLREFLEFLKNKNSGRIKEKEIKFLKEKSRKLNLIFQEQREVLQQKEARITELNKELSALNALNLKLMQSNKKLEDGAENIQDKAQVSSGGKIAELQKELLSLDEQNIKLLRANNDLKDELMDLCQEQSEAEDAQRKSRVKKEGQIAKLQSELMVLNEQTIKFLRSNNTLKDELGELYYKLGSIYTQNKFFKEAIDAHERALVYNPEKTENYYSLGLLYAHTEEDSSRAISLLEQYLATELQIEKRRKVEELIKMLK